MRKEKTSQSRKEVKPGKSKEVSESGQGLIRGREINPSMPVLSGQRAEKGENMARTTKIAVVLVISIFMSGTAIAQVFEDVPKDYWAARHIHLFASMNITGGCSEEPFLFCPDAPVTRAQMAVFVVEALRLALGEIPTTICVGPGGWVISCIAISLPSGSRICLSLSGDIVECAIAVP